MKVLQVYLCHSTTLSHLKVKMFSQYNSVPEPQLKISCKILMWPIYIMKLQPNLRRLHQDPYIQQQDKGGPQNSTYTVILCNVDEQCYCKVGILLESNFRTSICNM